MGIKRIKQLQMLTPDPDDAVLIQRGDLSAYVLVSGLSGGGSPDPFSFGTIAVSGQGDVVADVSSDTVTYIAGVNTTILTDAVTDSITFNANLGNLFVATATGAGSFVVPAGVTRIRFRIVGPGGGGGGTNATANTSGGGGGSGGYIEHIETVTPGDTITYSIGTAGTGGATTATAGTSSTITVNGVTYTAGAGQGGTATTAGAGGTNSGGTPLISVPGQTGGGASVAATLGVSSSGGNVFRGIGFGGLTPQNAAGSSGIGFGAGGSGASTNNATARTGGNGTNGYLEIEY